MSERKFHLEQWVPSKEFVPVEFTDAEKTIKVDGNTISYISPDARFDSDFAVYIMDLPDEPVSYDDELLRSIVTNIDKFEKEQKALRQLGWPREQVRFQSDDQVLIVSNYSALSLEQYQEEISRWVATMSSVVRDKLGNIKNIIILPDNGRRLETGEAQNGEHHSELFGIKLFPSAFQNRPHRTGVTTNLTGTLTHEFFHQYYHHFAVPALGKAWNELGGWKLNFRFPNIKPGEHVYVDEENLVESTYGLVHASEEFCDAAVKAIYGRNEFKDKRKRNFFDEHFLDWQGSIAPSQAQILPIKKPQVPEMRKHFTFTIVQPK